jgi:hypothetical protein
LPHRAIRRQSHYFIYRPLIACRYITIFLLFLWKPYFLFYLRESFIYFLFVIHKFKFSWYCHISLQKRLILQKPTGDPRNFISWDPYLPMCFFFVSHVYDPHYVLLYVFIFKYNSVFLSIPISNLLLIIPSTLLALFFPAQFSNYSYSKF